MDEHYDVVIVGAGSTGGVLASRLTENADRRVLLLDAGPDFPWEAEVWPQFVVSGEHSWRIGGTPEFDWHFQDLDRAGRRGGRPIRLPRGRLVGGSSMVNSTIAARPAPFDLDRWAALGCPGWDWASTLPYFIRIERDLDFGDEAIHGRDGPIVINRYKEDTWAPVNRVFAEACDALGIKHARDLNGIDAHTGIFGALPHNRFKEVRLGTLVTYIRTARPRSNLTIRALSLVDRVVFEGERAVGVTYESTGGLDTATADLVVLSAGVYNTPAILQRSGVGGAALLAGLGIPIVKDVPHVGQNLVDHVGCAFPFSADRVGATTGRLFAVNWRSEATEGGEPCWQTHPFPIDAEEGICGLWTYLCRQESSGTVQITSSDPRITPLVDHDYLASQSDVARFKDAWDRSQELLATAPFKRYNSCFADIGPDFVDYLHRGIGSAHHQSGTCRMGTDPEASVVDPRLFAHGLQNLMIADSSIFPDTVMHNTNLACYVVGEIAADIIRARR
jgi:choline dehydrogenase